MAQREEGQAAIRLIVVVAVLLFLLFLILNVGKVIFAALLTILNVVLAVILIVVGIALVLWIAATVLTAISDSEDRIKTELESLKKTFLRVTYKSGSEFLNLVTTILTYFIQDAVAAYSWPYKASISLMFTLNLFFVSQLIGSRKRFDRIIGIILFVGPVVIFGIIGAAIGKSQLFLWFSHRSTNEIALMATALVGTVLTFIFALLKEQEVS